jgi:hypothetical protein
VTRTCLCGRSFEAKTAKRLYCSPKCRRAAFTARQASPPPDPERPDSVVAETRSELEKLGALRSVEGQAALRLAAQVDAPRSAMAVSGDVARLLVVMATIRDASPREADSVDNAQADVEAKLRLVR